MDNLVIAGKTYTSRLLVGTGKYKDFNETRMAIEASGAEIITVAIRRTDIGQNANEPNLLDTLPPTHYTLLPNTAGCYTVEDEQIMQEQGVMVQSYWRSLYRHVDPKVKGADMHATFEHHHYKWWIDA